MLNEELIKQLLELRTSPHGEGASEAEIAQAESAIGLKFPENFRHFISVFGWGGFGHIEIYGVGSGVPDFLNLTVQVEIERNKMKPHLFKYLIPLSNDGFGNHICLDTRGSDGVDCPVVFWNHELPEKQEPEVEAESFAEWLTKIVAEIEP